MVSGSEKGEALLQELLKGAAYTQIDMAKSGNEARRLLNQGKHYELVLINAPLSDEWGYDLASLVTESSDAGVMLLVKNEYAGEMASKVEDDGVLVVPKPLSRPFFYQALKLVEATHKRLLRLQKENMKLQTKIEEIRLVNRAKYVLIEYLNMTEPQAHRYIEKQAMDMRKNRREIAQSILETYEQ